MAELTTQIIIAGLAAAFPQAKLGADNVRMYVRALADLPADELAPVAQAFAADAQWFPTIRELRRAVMEARLRLPGADDAWELALAWANEPTTTRCPDGCNLGMIEGTDADRVQLDRSLLDGIESKGLRAALERMADAAASPRKTCPTCDGEGEVANPRRPTLPEAVRRALDHVGGRSGITDGDSISVVRAQFLKAYERQRDEAVRRESLTSAGLGELTQAARPELTT